MIFPAKVDLWFLALFYGLGALMILCAPFIRKQARSGVTAIVLLVCGLLFLGVGWRASAVEYVLTQDGHLDATGWPFDGRITSLDAIRRIEPSNDPRASHAASLDRLRIDHGNGQTIFIAVHDKAAFLDAVAERSAVLRRTARGVERTDRPGT